MGPADRRDVGRTHEEEPRLATGYIQMESGPNLFHRLRQMRASSLTQALNEVLGKITKVNIGKHL